MKTGDLPQGPREDHQTEKSRLSVFLIKKGAFQEQAREGGGQTDQVKQDIFRPFSMTQSHAGETAFGHVILLA
jgi:hypothetical protein